MGFFDNIKENFGLKAKDVINSTNQSSDTGALNRADDIFKAFIPEFLYKPPFGFPRKVNIPLLKLLAKNSYIFSVIKTITDEASSVDWEIIVKDEFQDDNTDYEKKLKDITNFFDQPNNNGDSFDFLMRQLIPGILELDTGLIVKVFNAGGNLDQLFVRDGGTFLKNPDIYGYLGNRQDFIKPTIPEGMENPTIRQQFDMEMRQDAAYFQFGWTAGSMPVPFGRKEIVWIEQNPRYDSIYGRSPLEVLESVIKTLVYGAGYNLSFYENNNMPEGAIQLLGANKGQIDGFRQRFESQFRAKDVFGNKIKNFFKFPISSTEVKFTPFQILSKELEVMAQQEWFTKLVWMCFGVTAEEMGFTENSNKAVSEQQTKVAKRKALQPLLRTIQHAINTQIMPEFFDETPEEEATFRDIPCEFRFKLVDKDEEKSSLDMLDQKIRMGVMTPDMAALELGIDVTELDESRQKHVEQDAEHNDILSTDEDGNDINKKVEEKSQANPQNEKEFKEIITEIDEFVDDVSTTFHKAMDKII